MKYKVSNPTGRRERFAEVDCAILAIAAKFCPSTVEMLSETKIPGHLSFCLPDLVKRMQKESIGKTNCRNDRFCQELDRPELYRRIDNELQWGIHDPYTRN